MLKYIIAASLLILILIFACLSLPETVAGSRNRITSLSLHATGHVKYIKEKFYQEIFGIYTLREKPHSRAEDAPDIHIDGLEDILQEKNKND